MTKAVFDAARTIKGAPLTQADVNLMNVALGGTGGASHTLKDPSAFFSSIRKSLGGGVTEGQVAGFNRLTKAMTAWSLYDAAYGLATAWHETARMMQPVREAFWTTEAWRKKNLRYYPWYGRGDVQTTWEVNYQRADDELGLGGSLMANPDRMLEPEISAKTMVLGMEQGWFTGKKNSDYTHRDYVKRRAMINGTDKAAEIGDIAQIMESALIAGGW